ncbi:MAG: hypothetical protein FWD01_03340 [Defluviitaleaceae bacterium]|nr:hypothetical protein [Defluviitaleaceae bacterium]
MKEKLDELLIYTLKSIETALDREKMGEAEQSFVEKRITRYNILKDFQGKMKNMPRARGFDIVPTEVAAEQERIFFEEHDITEELKDAEHYLELAVKHNSREYLSMAKDEVRHAEMLLTMVQRKLHDLSYSEAEQYNILLEQQRAKATEIKNTRI